MMTRLELESAIRQLESDEPFTMPFFLAGCLVDMMKRQGLRYFDLIAPGASVTARAILETNEKLEQGNVAVSSVPIPAKKSIDPFDDEDESEGDPTLDAG